MNFSQQYGQSLFVPSFIERTRSKKIGCKRKWSREREREREREKGREKTIERRTDCDIGVGELADGDREGKRPFIRKGEKRETDWARPLGKILE